MSVHRAISEIAHVANEVVACRDAGFTKDALNYPRDHAGLVAICAFNGIDANKAPRGWHYYPNAAAKKAWERVVSALADEERKAG